jgi:hypothetical protein
MVGCEMFGLMMGGILPSFILPKDEQTVMPVEHLRRMLMFEAGVVLLLVPCVFLFFRSEKIRKPRGRSVSSEPSARRNSSNNNSMTSESKFVSLSQAERYARVTRLIEHTRDELRPQSDHPVCKQYRLLLRDSCYRYMLCAGSLSFCFSFCVYGLMPLYLDAFGFDKVRTTDQTLAAYLSMGFLIAVSSQRQPELRGVIFLQMVSLLSHFLLLAGLYLTDIYMLVGALVLFGTSVFPSFSTIMVLIGRRIGSNFELIGTSTLLYLSKCLALGFFAAVDLNYHAAASKRRVMSVSVLAVVCMSTMSLVFGLLSISHQKKLFLDE